MASSSSLSPPSTKSSGRTVTCLRLQHITNMGSNPHHFARGKLRLAAPVLAAPLSLQPLPEISPALHGGLEAFGAYSKKIQPRNGSNFTVQRARCPPPPLSKTNLGEREQR